jgi:hypothetical protein
MSERTHDKHSHEAGANLSNAAHADQPPPALSEKQRRELWLYIAVAIASVELLAGVMAVVYGFMQSSSATGQRGFAFPLLYWAATALLLPALILLLVHFADVGLFKTRAGKNSDEEWQRHLPDRMQRLYRIIKGAPAAVILLGIVALGAGLMTIDGALGLILEFAAALKPHIPHIIAALTAAFSIIVLAVALLHYRTRKLIAEYQFRREVLEKTGIIIVDKDSVALPPGGIGDVPYRLVGAEDKESPRALPAAENRESGA